MMRRGRDFRLIPLVLVAAGSLLALKVSGLVLDGGYTLADRMRARAPDRLKIVDPASVPDHPRIVRAGDPEPAPVGAKNARKKSWAQEMFNFQSDEADDVTGSVEKKDEKTDPAPPPLKASSKPPDQPRIDTGAPPAPSAARPLMTAGERAILESLQNRREELDRRARELDMRENLLKAAEKRIEAKVNELKEMEARIKAEMGERDKAEAEHFKAIITMYETMKPKDAARIFDKLDMKVLLDVALAMNPRSMSEILAQMTPEAAERLTVELANRSGVKKTAPGLPKIENKTSGS
ncbi:MAG: flagellar protein FlbB [Pseudolabrys sp.]|nr:flagellar protein FlbB [Pseudolabrys sp.]